MRSRTLIQFLGILALTLNWAYAEQPFNDSLVQPLELKSPARGSIAGDLSSVNLSVSGGQAATGGFQLKLPLSLPELRGTLIHDFRPTYSPLNSLSEWGMGFQNSISIYRFREEGGLDFATDSLMSPWGLLIRGQTGDYYPKGLSARVRVRMLSPDQLIAFLPDGAKLRFGGPSAFIQTEGKGIYAWFLQEGESALGSKSRFQYMSNPSGALYLSEVLYAEKEGKFQYRVSIQYEGISIPSFDYRSGARIEKDRRVKKVDVQSLTGDGQYSEVYHFVLRYLDTPLSPRFFLTEIQKRFPTGEEEPPVSYTYNDGAQELLGAHWQHLPHLDPLLENKNAVFYPEYSAQVDLRREGLASFETRIGFDLVHLSPGAYQVEKLSTEKSDSACRPVGDVRRTPRQYFPMRGPKQEYEAVDLYPNGRQSQLIACSREGQLIARTSLEGSWDLGQLTRLIDLNHRGKPDLIKVFRGGYVISPNQSDEAHPYAFGAVQTKKLIPEVTPLAFWVLDMNGDGIPDLVVKTQSGIFIWYGKGNFEFETQGEYRTFKTASGRKAENLSNLSLSFVDVNHDGLMDVFLTSKTNTQIFLNTGSDFVEQTIPGLKDKLGLINSYPIIADLKSTGNTQVDIFQAGKAYSAELESPSSGLLISAEDGKGTKLDFRYRRASPEPGIIQRQPLLSEVTTSIVGQKPVRTRYEYQGPRFHSKQGRLLGYEWVTSLRGHSTVQANYIHGDDWASGLLAGTLEQDQLSQVSKFSRSTFQNTFFDGIPIQLVEKSENGWTMNSTRPPDAEVISSTETFQAYDEKLCALKIQKESKSNTLFADTEYVYLPRFADHFICHAANITLRGVHADRTFDFSHSLKTSRNEKGQPLQILRVSGAQNQIAQELTYNPQGDLIALRTPATGEIRYSYDVNGRLSQIAFPDGKVSRMNYDEVRDLPLSIQTLRGNSNDQWIEFFRYNFLGLLSTQWSNLTGGNKDNPDSFYEYYFANHQSGSLARIEASKRIDRTWSREISFFTAGGTEIAQAEPSSDGLVVSNIKVLDPELDDSTQLGTQFFHHRVDLNSLSLEKLSEGGQELGKIQNTSLGLLEQELHTIQKQVVQFKKYSSQIVPEGLALHRTENSSFLTTSIKDANGNLVRFKDEGNNDYHYSYDALNRLRKIVLPKKEQNKDLTHTVQYDGMGRVSLISRDEVGSIEYHYENQTGLIESKIYKDVLGVPVRKVSQSYDSIGRVIQVVYLNLTQRNEQPEVFSYRYDGKLSEGVILPGQIGFLTSVHGPGFSKEFKYRPDGKLLEQKLKLSDETSWVTQIEYRSDRSIFKKTTDIGGSNRQKKTVAWAFDLDQLGRESKVTVNSQSLLEYKYNKYSEIEKLIFSNDSGLEFSYDEWTHQKNKISKSFQNSKKLFETDWTKNNRGLIDQENVYGTRRNYVYSDPRGFLTSSDDTQKFEYDSIGMIDLPQRQVQTDSSGRITASGSVHYAYNGMGRVSEAVSLPQSRVEYGYDEQGIRLFKKVGGVIREIYQNDAVYDGEFFYEPLKISGTWVDLIKDGKPLGLTADMRGSVVLGPSDLLNLPTAYGERTQRDKVSRIVDYVSQGFDPDLGAYRMAQRDYDPKLKRFLTADPLFLESPEKCLESPHECNLYSYAKGNPISYGDPSGLDSALIVGGPYKGHNYGHVALRVFGNGYDKTYDFGRYHGGRGLLGSEGDGVMRVWNSFSKYIAGENATGRASTGYTFHTTPEQDRKAIAYFDSLIKGIKPELVRTNEMKQYVLKSDYHWGNNNCTTMSLKGFEAGTGLHLNSDNAGRGMSFGERSAARIAGWPSSTFMPFDLKITLDQRKDVQVETWPKR